MGFPSLIKSTVWSPCSRFVAVVLGALYTEKAIEILDAVILERLAIIPLDEQSLSKHLMFSPNGRFLTRFDARVERIITWDIQTGVLVSTISLKPLDHLNIAYSTCGTIVGLFSHTAISTYDILSGTHIYSHSVTIKKPVGIWAHGQCFQFATEMTGTITIWEVGCTSTHALREVKSLPIPDDPHYLEHYFSHPISLLASIGYGKVYIWGAQCSKYLLGPIDITSHTDLSFSSDGHFFAYGTLDSGVYLWKESPTGYILHQKLISNAGYTTPRISPNGELVLTVGDSVVQLWHTTGSKAPLPSIPTQVLQKIRRPPLLGFSPDEALAIVTQKGEKIATVLDLKPSAPRLTIDAGLEIYGLGMTSGTIIVIGDKKIITWNLPARDCITNPRVNIGDSVRTTTFDLPKNKFLQGMLISVSPDLHHMAIIEVVEDTVQSYTVDLYDTLTGQHLCRGDGGGFVRSSFILGKHELWCVNEFWTYGWKILRNDNSNATKLENLGSTKSPPDGLPWQCPPGYKVTNDGWILNCSGKRLLWLPPNWWPDRWDRIWHGRFLALLNDTLPEVLIVELE